MSVSKSDGKAISKAIGGALTTNQIRILKVLQKTNRDSAKTRDQLVVGVYGKGSERKYSSKFNNELWGLYEGKGYIKIEEQEETGKRRKYWHYITPEGRKALEKAESALLALEESHKERERIQEERKNPAHKTSLGKTVSLV